MPIKFHLVKAMILLNSCVWMWELDVKKSESQGINAFEAVVLEKLLESPLTARRSIQSILKEISPEYSLKGLIVNWNSNTLATCCKELIHWQKPWCWERLMVGGEGDNRGWDGWMASPSWWPWVWINSGS